MAHPAKKVAQPTRHFWFEDEKQGKGVGLAGRRWPVIIRWLPVARCSGEGSESKPAGQRTRFGVAEERGLTRGACPWRRRSAAGEEGRQAGVVVAAGGVGVVGEELLGDTKLGLGSRGSRDGWRSPAPGGARDGRGFGDGLWLLVTCHGGNSSGRG
jgi:hypothetical protein